MQNRKKLVPAVILGLALTLAPISWAGGPQQSGSLGPLDWLKIWIVQLLEGSCPNPPESAGPGDSQQDELGNLIIPSG